MQAQDENNPDVSWINFHRKVSSLYKVRYITRWEYLTYMHLRLNCNIYGVCTASISAIRNDVFGRRASDNYVNKMLLGLRSKKLIWYERRQGSRGSFEVHFGDFLLPGKKIKTLNKYFDPQSVRSEDGNQTPNKSEDTSEIESDSQKLKVQESDFKSMFSWLENKDQVRSYNNDNKNKKENNNYKSVARANSFNKFGNREDFLVEDFYPKSYEQEQVWKIAKGIGEEDMRFLLSILERYGLGIIEKAYEEYRKKAKDGVRNPPAYFNRIIKRLLGEQ